MNIRYYIMYQLVGAPNGTKALAATSFLLIAIALCLGHGTASAVTFQPPLAQDSQTTATSQEAVFPSSGLMDAPSLDAVILGGEPSEEDAMLDALGNAPSATAPASADTLQGLATKRGAYSAMASARGFKSSSGRGWGRSLIVAGFFAGVAAGILVEESSRHTAHGASFNAPGISQSPNMPSSMPSLGSDETPSNDFPTSVPEPGTAALFAAGIAISAAFRRRLIRT